MGRILILEDCDVTRGAYRDALGQEHILKITDTLEAALIEAANVDFDLMLIDLHLPDGLGFDFCRRLRLERGSELPPFIFVSSSFNIHDKLTGFALGAEDYIVKPFDHKEMLARVEIRLRRKLRPDLITETAAPYGLIFDAKGLRVYRLEGEQKRDLALTPNEFRILRVLLSKIDQAVTRQELLHSGWGKEVHVLERTVDRHISGLRRKLGTIGLSIEAIPSEGYRWNGKRSA